MIRVEQIQGVSNSVGRILEEMRKNLLKEKNYIPQLSSGRGMTQENKQAVKTLEENLKKKMLMLLNC